MPLHHVTYDLTKPETSEDYVNLIEAIKKAGGVKTQYSAWLVPSASSAKGIFDYLKPHIHEKDRLMVIEIESRPSWNTGFEGTRALINSYFPV